MRGSRLRERSVAAHISIVTRSVAIASLVLAGCRSGSGGGGAVDPDPEPPLFSRLWPNADGNEWSYDYQRHFATAPMIAELEGLEDLAPEEIDHLDLERRLIGDLPEIGETEEIGVLTLRFNGTIPSLDGPKQNLESELVPIAKTLGGRERFVASEAIGSSGVSPIIARIYAARPDLRERMAALGYVPARYHKTSAPATWPPFTLDDGKFEKQENWMGMYGDLNADSSYTIIRGPLDEGAFFRHQLVPELADSIWEYGWILGKRDVSTPAGTFDAIGVVYFLDFGETAVLNDRGEEIARFRSYSIYSLYFAPDVGPVYQRVLDFLAPPIPELAIDIGVLFSETALREYEVE